MADHHDGEATRRDFLYIATAAMGAVGAAYVAWPFIDQMNPSKATLALASIEVDLSPIAPGQSIKVMWRGKPVFVRNRTEKEIAEAKAVDISTLRDPETDEQRTLPGHENWLVMIGVCTHLGCVPLGEAGDFGGWFCPCHGSHYDTAGRIRKGPAPRNLDVPQYAFVSDDRIVIG
ncbi:MAG: ubiquinol-cytochrome c reductase iron-sulfur subunit [Rhodothalassiaceae bacterium]